MQPRRMVLAILRLALISGFGGLWLSCEPKRSEGSLGQALDESPLGPNLVLVNPSSDVRRDPSSAEGAAIEIENPDAPTRASLRLRFVGTEGQCIQKRLIVAITEIQPTAVVAGEGSARALLFFATATYGVASWTDLPPGVPWRVYLRDRRSGLRETFDVPPIGAGRHVTRTIVSQVQRPLLRGRILDGATSEPLCNSKLRAHWIQRSRRGTDRWDYELDTDAEGRFLFAPPLEDESMVYRLSFRRELGGTAPQTIASSLTDEMHDLGDLSIDPWPVALAGRVMDTADRGVAGAVVSVFWEDSCGPRYSYSTEGQGPGYSSDEVVADGEGRFTWIAPPIDAEAPDADPMHVRVCARSKDRRSEDVAARRGEMNVRVRLD